VCQSLWEPENDYLDGNYYITAKVLEHIKPTVMVETASGNSHAMLDAGANLHVITRMHALQLGLVIHFNTSTAKIGTADSNNCLSIDGWVDIGGYIGRMAVVEAATCSLLSTSLMQSKGMGSNFKSDVPCCVLYTKEGVFSTVEQCPTTRLYYVNLEKFVNISIATTNTRVCHACTGVFNVFAVNNCSKCKVVEEKLIVAGPLTVTMPISKKHHKPTADMSFRVWRLHFRTEHTPLRILTSMAAHGHMGIIDCEAWEIQLVDGHQHCFSCALATMKRLPSESPSGLRPTVLCHEFSLDYQGPYATKALGGFNGKFTAVERKVGLGLVFLVKSKRGVYNVIRLLVQYCAKHGWRMHILRVDAGTVENAAGFVSFCATIYGDEGPGIEVRPAAPGNQNQDPVERHIQSVQNQIAATIAGQDLLPGMFWGWANISVWLVRNGMSNSLCPDSTPLYEVEGRTTDLARSHLHGFGQPVVVTDLSMKFPKHDGVTRNQFAVVVCSVNIGNRTSVVWFPDKKTHSIASRKDVRAIQLGPRPRLTYEAGKGHLPILGPDGSWHITTRGDSDFLGHDYLKKIMQDENCTIAND
jgi:hypothetical protein